MLDIISEIKAFMAVQSAVASIKKTGALSVLDASHIGALLAIAGTFYASAKDLVPPQYGVAAGIVLSLLFLAYSFVLKLHGQTAAPIAGIPALDPTQLNAIVASIETKYPQLVNYKEAFDAALALAKTAAPAPAAVTVNVDAPVVPAAIPVSPLITK